MRFQLFNSLSGIYHIDLYELSLTLNFCKKDENTPYGLGTL